MDKPILNDEDLEELYKYITTNTQDKDEGEESKEKEQVLNKLRVMIDQKKELLEELIEDEK